MQLNQCQGGGGPTSASLERSGWISDPLNNSLFLIYLPQSSSYFTPRIREIPASLSQDPSSLQDLLSPVSVVVFAVHFVSINMCTMKNRLDHLDVCFVYLCVCFVHMFPRKVREGDAVSCLGWIHSDW